MLYKIQSGFYQQYSIEIISVCTAKKKGNSLFPSWILYCILTYVPVHRHFHCIPHILLHVSICRVKLQLLRFKQLNELMRVKLYSLVCYLDYLYSWRTFVIMVGHIYFRDCLHTEYHHPFHIHTVIENKCHLVSQRPGVMCINDNHTVTKYGKHFSFFLNILVKILQIFCTTES